MIDKEDSKTITFWLGGMLFEYDEWKNEYNITHHRISFRQAARVFLTTIELNYLMRKIVILKIVMIQLEIWRQDIGIHRC